VIENDMKRVDVSVEEGAYQVRSWKLRTRVANTK